MINCKRLFAEVVLGRFYWPLFIAVSFIISYLNMQSLLMGDVFNYYLGIKEVITNNFNYDLAYKGNPTFPMWGYSFLLILFDDLKYLYFFQLIAFIGAMFLFERVLAIYFRGYSFALKSYFRFLLLLSFSFIGIQATPTPYGVSLTLLILFTSLLAHGLYKNSLTFILLSGFILGAMLNFRSDYIYLILLIIPIIFLHYGFKRGLGYSFLLSIILLLTLSPYAAYHKGATGELGFKSSNGGHVFFIGLGNLPNNNWGITEFDADPRMHQELKQEFGEEISSLSYKASPFLMNRWKDLVKDNPLEYIQKVLYSASLTLVSGIYVPDFVNLRKNCEGDCKAEFIKDIKSLDINELLSKDKIFLYSLTIFAIAFGCLIILLSIISIPALIKRAYYEREIILMLLIAIFLYQLALNSFAFQMKLYTTNIFWISLLFASQFISFLRHFRKKQQ